MECITYRDGYKYQLTEDYSVRVGISPPQPVITPFLELTAEGVLTIRKAYAWDGASGPAIDTLNSMRGSLVHDALYQLMRDKHLDHDKHREAADRLLQKICREDGMSAPRAWAVYQGVRLFGKPFADPRNRHAPIRAPKGCG